MNKPNLTINIKEQIKKDREQDWNVQDAFKLLKLEELKELVTQDRYDYAVCLLNLTGDLNVGTTMRTASIMGAKKFILFGRKKFDRRSTVGAQNYLDLAIVEGLTQDYKIDIEKFWFTMSEHKLWPIFIETTGRPLGTFLWTDLFDGNIAHYTPCLIFGNETFGIPEELYRGYPTIQIPQRGVLRSLNVSAAAAIVMWDLVSNYFEEGL